MRKYRNTTFTVCLGLLYAYDFIADLLLVLNNQSMGKAISPGLYMLAVHSFPTSGRVS